LIQVRNLLKIGAVLNTPSKKLDEMTKREVKECRETHKKAELSKNVSFLTIFNWILNHPRQIAVIFITITVCFALQLPRLSFETNIEHFLIDNCIETDCYRKLQNEFMSDDIIRIVIKSENIFDSFAFRKIEQLAETASAIEGVDRVISLPHIKQAIDVSHRWKPEEFADLLGPANLFDQNIFSDDHTVTSLTLILDNKASRTKIIESINQKIINSSKDLPVYQVGMPLVAEALANHTQTDFFKLPPLTFLVITLILLVLLRNISCVLTILASICLSLVWTLGLMALTSTPLSMISMIIPVFLIAVGTAYFLYICVEYLSCARKATTSKEAVQLAFSRVSLPTLLAVLTTMVGLSSLYVYHIHYIKEFSVFSCFGVFCLLVFGLIFIPVILSLAPLPRKETDVTHPNQQIFDKFLDHIIIINQRKTRFILSLIVCIIICIFSGSVLIKVESNPISYFKPEKPIRTHFNDINKHLSGSLLINVLVEGNSKAFFEKPSNIETIAIIQESVERIPGIGKSLSFADYLKFINYVQNKFDSEKYILPQQEFEVRMLINSFETIIGKDTLAKFMNADFTKTNLLLFTKIINSQNFIEIKETILNQIRFQFPPNIKWEVTGFGIAVSKSNQLLASGLLKSLGVSLALIFAIVTFLFLSFKIGFIAISANIFPILTSLGIMGWMGIELSMATSLFASVAFGLAVDDTIHYLARYNREFRIEIDNHDAMRKTLKQLGRPIIFTSLTLCLGFSVLVFSSFKPTAHFGILMITTMFAALLSALFFVPTLVMKTNIISMADIVRLRLGTAPEKRLKIFGGFTRIQLYFLLLNGKLKLFDSGTVIFSKGDFGDSIFVVITGELDIINPVEISKLQVRSVDKWISTLKEGDIFGEGGFLESKNRSATVLATKPGELLEIEPAIIKRLQKFYPWIASKFYKNLSEILNEKLCRTTERLVNETMIDDITGLYNLRGFMRILEKELDRSQLSVEQLYLSVFSIKPDTDIPYSEYEIKKHTLICIGDVICRNARKQDTVALINREIFLLLLTNIPLNSAQEICNQIRTIIESTVYGIDDYNLNVKVDFKLYDLIEDSDIIKHLIEFSGV
jgi:predicted RND superfamily exporter protein/CRP-like cAMP-binding protein